jgi:hypothetical protein
MAMTRSVIVQLCQSLRKSCIAKTFTAQGRRRPSPVQLAAADDYSAAAGHTFASARRVDRPLRRRLRAASCGDAGDDMVSDRSRQRRVMQARVWRATG